jgi:hypothetical protein
MAESDVYFEIRESLVGHSLGLSAHYLRHSEQKVISEYLKCVDSLTINNEFRLRKKVEILQVRKDRIDQLEQTLIECKERLGI